MPSDTQQTSAFCRKCGDDRTHNILAKEEKNWGDQDIHGCDTWFILECAGCHTTGFRHESWDTESLDYDDDGNAIAEVRISSFPPAPRRQMPEFGIDILLHAPQTHSWINRIHKEIYEALGLDSFMLAAMGARAIIDFIVTFEAGDSGDFPTKVKRLVTENKITDLQGNMVGPAFDTGSAAIHRGHRPIREDVFLLLDIAEMLIEKFYVEPHRMKSKAEQAAKMKERVPPRKKS